MENAADAVEQAIEDFTRAQPAKVDSTLSDQERNAALAIFWQLVREQGGQVAGVTAVVYEDAAMVLCLQRLHLIDGGEPTTSDLRELAGEPPEEEARGFFRGNQL